MSSLTPLDKSGLDYAKALLISREAYASSLLLLLLDRYGAEPLGVDAENPGEPEESWTATAVRMQLEGDLGVTLPSHNLDKLMAAIALLTTNDFFQRLPRFIRLCSCLVGDELDPEQFEPASVREMTWSVTEALLLYPPDQQFSPEIQGYIRHRLQHEGFTQAPEALRIVLQGVPLEVDETFDDDPEMFAAFYQKRQSDAEELDRLVRDNLLELAGQLERLPLSSGNAESLVKKIRAHFKPVQTQGTQT